MTDAMPRHHHDKPLAGETTMVKDPVCGRSVDPATAKHHADYHGISYYFCCAGCQAKFTAEPTSPFYSRQAGFVADERGVML